MVFQAASGPWCMPIFLEVCGGTGARRGEVLALRWSYIKDGRATIAQSLTQTKEVLEFKGTKERKAADDQDTGVDAGGDGTAPPASGRVPPTVWS